jgi:hypothetical protein
VQLTWYTPLGTRLAMLVPPLLSAIRATRASI